MLIKTDKSYPRAGSSTYIVKEMSQKRLVLWPGGGERSFIENL